MLMIPKNHHLKSRALSMFLVMLMLLSTTFAIASTASASMARSYTTNRDPQDVAIGDFNCDGFNDLAMATDGTHTITILWNDGNGDFSERQDIWVSKNTSRDAEWDEFSNVQFIEVGEFTGDDAIDIVIFQRNNPFKTDDNGAPAGDPGNVTIIENGGCTDKSWSIGARFTHFYAWDLAVGDANQDGNDDVFILDLMSDITTQRVVTYRGPITSNTQGMITTLGSSQQNTYRNMEVGDWGETETGLSGTCSDDDIWLQRAEGLDYATGTVTNPGNDDNMSIIEFSCLTNTYPATYTFSATNPPLNTHVINMNTVTSDNFDIGDMDGDAIIDVMVLNDANLENVTYVTSSAVGTWTSPTLAYFGPYLSWQVTVADLNGDQEPDFINPTIAYQQNSSDSAGGSTSSFYLNFPTTVQVTLSDGNGGHLSPLSYAAGRRPNVVEVGQLAGSSSSADDLVVGHKNWRFNGWRDNFGWEGQYDTVSVIEMDNKDLSVSSIEISPVDKFYGSVGEGTRNINVTVTNTGMDTLNGLQATLNVELKVVDQANSSNTSVYEMDWDAPENKASCSGCTWSYEEYVDQSTYWHEETNHSMGATDGNNDPNVSANYNNPTDFMWAGQYKTNSSGDSWSGYGRNWDDAMVLEDVDLTGSDRAFMSLELFQHLGHGVLGSVDAAGNYIPGDVWDDIAMIEIGSVETGWSTIACPQSAQLSGACASGESMWGGFDIDRIYKINNFGSPEFMINGVYSFGTYYGWNNFTEEGVGAFDLSPWAGETVDIRFRLRTGFEGSISNANESRWEGRDGFAVDNISIWKQTTAFEPNPQVQQANVPLNNLGPGQEYTSSITADLLNDTIYRISATLTGNTWDEQPQNNEIVAYVTPFNLYDPMVESLESFTAGGLYAEGLFDIEVVTNNWGNTAVDFDIKATVYSATPSDIYCGTPPALCEETFEGGATGYRYEESQNPQGGIHGESICSDKIFNNYAYWFGHPCDTGANGYGEIWNETLTIPNVDLTSMNGDFVSLNFEYYADTFYRMENEDPVNIDLDSVNDYAVITLDILRNGAASNGLMLGQWNDYNQDGTCRNDDNGDNIVNETESIDYTEISFVGDPTTIDGSGNSNILFFNTNDLVATTSIDLTHLFIQNRTGSSGNWGYECTSLAGSTVDINFVFQSDDDGRNGVNDGFKGVAFNNISLQEFTFVEDNSYTISRTNVDADQSSTDVVASHEFFSGVYKIEVETVFDNTTAGKTWFNDNELSISNNRETVIFNVQSVDITLFPPNALNCLDDQTLECVMPIDSVNTHDWTFRATNGVLPGEYVFNMNIDDMTTGSQAHTMTAGPAKALGSHEVSNVTFTPWNGWLDGHEYNISFDAELVNGNPSGNVRYFHATFADHVDVAILSDTSTRTSTIKEDLDILGMTYTQFEINDWETYLSSEWFTHYDKIILPWQTDIAAKDLEDGGHGYYDTMSADTNKLALRGFMSAGGTVQVHLGPQGTAVYGGGSTDFRLPFDLFIQEKNDADAITYSNTDFADPYHPIMEDVDLAAFQGFNLEGTVANAVLKTHTSSVNTVPQICGGDSESEKYGTFQRIIRRADGTPADQKDTLLGVCSYQSGGMIISTIDVASHSERADSTTLPLLGNMLNYQVTPYPSGFGIMSEGLELQINGVTPEYDSSTFGYKSRYIKSDAELTFTFITDTTESLETDWIIDGPTSWSGATMASGTDHTTDASPTMTFCKIDLASITGCAQDVQWDITLILHDDAGHSRVIKVTVKTNDVYADEFRPNADAEIDIRDEYSEQVEFTGTNTVLAKEWSVHRIILDENGEVTIYFDASNSSDEDSLDGNGIERYQWKVLFDAPYGDDDFAIEGHSFVQTSASDGLFAYTFRNTTVSSGGISTNQIRIELVVFDGADKFSETHRMYFDVVPDGFGDQAPDVDIDLSADQACPPALAPCKIDSDTITLSGTVLSGAEKDQKDVYVEISLMPNSFNASATEKYRMDQNGTFRKTNALGDLDTFNLTLSLNGKYTNKSHSQDIYIKYYEGQAPNERFITYELIVISLPACQGVEANLSAEAAGGEWVLDADNKCQWSDTSGTGWTLVDGEWSTPQGSEDDDSSNSIMDTMLMPALILLALVIVVLFTLFFMSRGSEDDTKDFSVGASGFGGVIDQTEQYVQQLIAQGYPEETARAYAQQYAAQAAAVAPAAVAAAPVAVAAPAMDNAVYQQYYQQFVSQGYDAETAATYAQQYALQYAQSQQ